MSNDVIAFSSEDIDDMYDVPRKPNLKKSNSRVSSNGKLRLRVESFRNTTNSNTNNSSNNSNSNNNAKSSSGTQTDISVVRNSSKPEQQLHQEQSAYTGQFKKKAAPSKPAR